MLRVPIAHARAGMVLALPVYHPRRGDTVLLKEGRPLDARSVWRLGELGVREIWIRYPGFEIIEEYLPRETLEAQATIVRHVAEAFDAVTRDAHAELEYDAYRSAVASLLERLLANPRAAVFIQEMAECSRPALRHATTVCFVSVLMGLKLEGYLISERSRLQVPAARDVTSLGLGAMFHDVGMLRLDPEVVHRWNATLDESDEAWRRHVWIGFEMVRHAIGPAAAAAVLHHHQKYDGSGFPRRIRLDGSDEPLAGSDIHVFARIVAAADLFDRLRHPPAQGPDAEPVPTVRVLRRMQEKPLADWLDPVVFRALLAVTPPYPPGTIVELSNGVRGVVVEWCPRDPCRPTVQELPSDPFDVPRGELIAPRHVLRDMPEVLVVRAGGHDVSADNFFSQSPEAFELRISA